MEDWIKPDKKEGIGTTDVVIECVANPFEIERTQTVVFASGEKYKAELQVVQEKAQQVITIPEFDYLVASYEWTEDAGKDFDTATCFLNTGLPGVDNQMVGWSRNMQSTVWQVGSYLQHGGDNLHSGQEAVLINMNELLSDTNFPKLPEDIMVGMWGNWYEVKGTGKITVRYVAYKGGDMIKQGFGFVNQGGEMVYDGNVDTTVTAFGPENNADPKKLYTWFARMIYNKNTRDCFVQLVS